VRERASFNPMPSDAQIRFSDQVVLIRAPFRVTFAYAGPDQVWQSNWRGQMQLPDMIKITVRDSATGQVLNVSSAAIVHVNAPAECARAANVTGCLTARLKPGADKKEEQL
jgi:general secretion pathway protein J